MVAVQELSDRDMANRSTVPERLIGILFGDVIILMTDKAHFHLSGRVHKQNCRCWAEESPQQLQQRPLHSARVERQNFGVTGEDGRAVTATSARYVEMLRNFLTQELSRLGTELTTIWFQQDGATAFAARASMEVVLEKFPKHIISLHGEHPWPDLVACDYSLWGYLKAKVYIARPRTIDDHRIAIKGKVFPVLN
jgi:hypothetical protein